ncbi:hypothetical protein ACFZCF_01410 [Streptomyces sp. NPDC007945]|uniref:hypothetical protein n=1 Tax=Streptomyces sp. NPDC007945 TaxID=3364797 RepID=UPI0036E96E84
MGWTVLYIAFGLVALWLLGEVLLQYKARLRWRVLAFSGFLGVVAGVLLPSVAVIIAGAVAFAVGQTFVTLSFRRGFSTGWAIGGTPGASRRRKAGRAPEAGPTLEVTALSYDEPDAAPAHAPDAEAPLAGEAPVHAPQPLPEDTGQYGVYEQQPAGHAQPGYDTTGYGYDTYATGYGQQPAYDYGTAGAPQQYAAYSDPYIGPATDGQQYTQYYGDPYAPSYAYDTPPGGVWVPQQRDTDEQPPQTYPPNQYGYDPQQQDDQFPYRH